MAYRDSTLWRIRDKLNVIITQIEEFKIAFKKFGFYNEEGSEYSFLWTLGFSIVEGFDALGDVLEFALLWEDEGEEWHSILREALLNEDSDLPILKDLLFNDIEIDFGPLRLWLRGKTYIMGEP
jgi:hypothetical protein